MLTFDGDYHYTPSAAADGCAPFDSFTYQIADPDGAVDDAVVHVQIEGFDPSAAYPPQVDENSTTCSTADGATGSLGFQVFQSGDVPAAQPVLWGCPTGLPRLASGATAPLDPGAQVAVEVTALPVGTFDVVVSNGADPPLTDTMQSSVAACPAPADPPVDPTTTTTPTTTTSDPASGSSGEVAVAGVLPATR